MNVLVTGGAGFIGSNLVDRLLRQGHTVRTLDNLSTGFRDNVAPGAEFIEGDIVDEATMRRAASGMEVIYHQAARRSVFASVEDPLATDLANTHGTLVLLEAAVHAGVRRVVYASSSSVYGGAHTVPTPETSPLVPRSPYAVSKLAGEHYCRVFTELHGLETVSLRYFNVYGPRQRPSSPYAAVIPLFIRALAQGEPPVVHGDGKQSRDFTFIEDVVDANLAAAHAPAAAASGRAFNIACGDSHSLLSLLDLLCELLGTSCRPEHTGPRPGDVRRTQADITSARQALAFEPKVGFKEGLRHTVGWLQEVGAGWHA